MKGLYLTTSRLLKWGLIVPLIALPFSILQLKQLEWWQHLVLPIGGYVVIVFGTLAGWKLTDLAEKVGGDGARFAVRACVGMAKMCAIASLGWIAIPPAKKVPYFLTDWRFLVLVVVFGVFYALPPRWISRWIRRMRQQKEQRNG